MEATFYLPVDGKELGCLHARAVLIGVSVSTWVQAFWKDAYFWWGVYMDADVPIDSSSPNFLCLLFRICPNIQVKLLTSLSYLDHIATPQMSVGPAARDLGCVSPLSAGLKTSSLLLQPWLVSSVHVTPCPCSSTHVAPGVAP